jgi:uncharacterized membrane protein YkvA (DUF1232 family)
MLLVVTPRRGERHAWKTFRLPAMNTDGTARHYDDASFWRKIRRFAFAAGRSVVEKALVLYFCMRDSDTPAWAKAVILGALGYFILPFDAMPDLLPGVGFTDDLGVLATALFTLAAHLKPQHRERAREILNWKWEQQAPGEGRTGTGSSRPVSPAEILGVPDNADPAAIRKAYRDQVKKYHPDRVQHLGTEFQDMAEERLKAINAAYGHFKGRYPELT